MRRARSAIVVVLLALLAACSAGRPAPLPAGAVVLALGDSITAGHGLASDQAWPALLARKTGWTVINGGESGDTAGDGLARLPALMQAHRPQLVLVELGGNDMLRRLPAEQTRSDLSRIIEEARRGNAAAALMAAPRPSVAGAVFRNLSAAAFYRELAEAQDVPLIEDALPDVMSDPRLRLDALHPNRDGQAALAAKTFDALRKLGYVR